MIREVLVKILPEDLYNFLKKHWISYTLKRKTKEAYLYDLNRYIKHSDILGINSSQKLISKIIREYHVIEKGLTMPKMRLGFGKEMIMKLCNDCIIYIENYGSQEVQLKHALGVLLEYETVHEDSNFQLDQDITSAIAKIRAVIDKIEITAQTEITKDEYFKSARNSFHEFASSRASVRNYIDSELRVETIIQALEIAKTTPSACNRQCWRTYLFSDKEQINNILQIQGGSRGFGHLTNKLIVIAAETSVFSGIYERNQVFIDGGMYAMNLLYALHYQESAACILNCSNSVEKDIDLRKLCKIKDSEVFIAMIACGIPPNNFKIASSKRYDLNSTHITL